MWQRLRAAARRPRLRLVVTASSRAPVAQLEDAGWRELIEAARSAGVRRATGRAALARRASGQEARRRQALSRAPGDGHERRRAPDAGAELRRSAAAWYDPDRYDHVGDDPPQAAR
jgi:hypothetical protein